MPGNLSEMVLDVTRSGVACSSNHGMKSSHCLSISIVVWMLSLSKQALLSAFGLNM